MPGRKKSGVRQPLAIRLIFSAAPVAGTRLAWSPVGSGAGGPVFGPSLSREIRITGITRMSASALRQIRTSVHRATCLSRSRWGSPASRQLFRSAKSGVASP